MMLFTKPLDKKALLERRVVLCQQGIADHLYYYGPGLPVRLAPDADKVVATLAVERFNGGSTAAENKVRAANEGSQVQFISQL